MERLALDPGERQHAAKRRPDARRPGDRERGAGDDRTAAPGPREQRLDVPLAVQAVDEHRRDEQHAHHDQQHRADVGQELLVLAKPAAQRGRREAEQDEDGGERRDEQQARGQHLAPVGAGELVGLEPGDRGEVAGHQRQHAGGHERDEAGDEGDRNVGAGDRIVQVGRPGRVQLSAAASRRRCSAASGCSGPSSVKIATITLRSRSRRSGSSSAVIADWSSSRAFAGSSASQAANASLRSVGAAAVARSGGLELEARQETAGHEVALGVVRQQGPRLVAVAARDQQPPERHRGGRVAGVVLERGAQRGLVAARGQAVGLGGEEGVEELLDAGRGEGAGELARELAVAKRLDRRDALHAEGLREHLVRVHVDLRELDLAAAGADRVLERGTELAAGAAPLGPEVDDDRDLARALDHAGLEIGLGDVVDHRFEGIERARWRRRVMSPWAGGSSSPIMGAWTTRSAASS